MSDVFISYSRLDKEFAGKLRDALAEQGQDVWIDWEAIPPSQAWWQEIQKGIARANNFVVVLSPNSMASPICQMEIEYARQLGKRIIPVFHRDFERKEAIKAMAERLAEDSQDATRAIWDNRQPHHLYDANESELKHINYFLFGPDDDFAGHFARLMEVIRTDYEHKERHTTYELRALEWDRRQRDAGFLLVDTELVDAEAWLQTVAAKKPTPTDLQRVYIQTSRDVENRRRRLLRNLRAGTLTFAVVGVIAAVLAISSFVSLQDTQTRADFAGTQAVDAELREAAAVTAVAGANTQLTAVPPTLTQVAQLVREGQDRIESLRLAAIAVNILNTLSGNPETAALLAVHALRTTYTTEADVALVNAIGYLSLNTLTGHTDAVGAIAISADGQYLLTAGEDNSARLWDTETGQEIQQFVGHSDKLSDVAFSPDGRYALTGSYDATARLWDLETGQEIQQFSGHESPVTTVAFNPNSPLVLTGSGDGTIRYWALETGREVQKVSLENEDAVVWDITFSPDGDHFITADSDAIASLWDSQSGEELFRYRGNNQSIWTAVFSPDGQYVFTGGEDAGRLWDVASRREIRQFVGHTDWLTDAVFSPDGRHILTGSRDGTARLWDVETGVEQHRFVGHFDDVNGVAFHPDGGRVFTASHDKSVRIWRVASGAGQRRLAGHTYDIRNAAFSQDGQYLLTTSNDARLWETRTGHNLQVYTDFLERTTAIDSTYLRSVSFSPNQEYFLTSRYFEPTVSLYDIRTGTLMHELVGHNDEVLEAVFSPDGQYILTASEDATAALWDVASGRRIRQFRGHTDWVSSVAFSPDGRYVLTGSWDRTARLWDTNTGQQIQQFTGNTREIDQVAFSPDGLLALTVSFTNPIRVWDVQTGAELQQYDENLLAAFSPDSQTILTVGAEKTAHLRDMKTGAVLQTFAGHTGNISSIAFSPDGQYLLTGSNDMTARLWDVQTGASLRVFEHNTRVIGVLFSPDSRYLLINAGEAAWVWNTDSAEMMDFACAHIYSELTPQERSEFGIAADALICPPRASH